ncbi:MAG TPA: hypothetical protein VHN99_06810 [Deinococcales bacterium]|nr:hypothetical protein [Deinococcales bacterium]
MKIHVREPDRLDLGGDNVTYLVPGTTVEVEPSQEVNRVLANGHAVPAEPEPAPAPKGGK